MIYSQFQIRIPPYDYILCTLFIQDKHYYIHVSCLENVDELSYFWRVVEHKFGALDSTHKDFNTHQEALNFLKAHSCI